MRSSDYQVGGSLRPHAQSYVVRETDQELYEAILNGEYCFVLNPRQVGKSSLTVRVVQKLKQAGFACAICELTTFGSEGATPQQYFGGLAWMLIRSLDFSDRFQLHPWIQERKKLVSPSVWFEEFLGDVLLKEVLGNIVIFLDEIDFLLKVDIRYDLFKLIRTCYNYRLDKAQFRRLSFVLIGVASPIDLIGHDNDMNSSPFNIGHTIILRGFQRDEAKTLEAGLVKISSNPQKMLDAIFEWTGGQPFLTQRLCNLTSKIEQIIPDGEESEYIKLLVQQKILDNWESKDECLHFKTIRSRILFDSKLTYWMLVQYQEILKNGEIHAHDSYETEQLCLTGLVIEQAGKLKVYNQIYRSIFNEAWVEATLKAIQT